MAVPERTPQTDAQAAQRRALVDLILEERRRGRGAPPIRRRGPAIPPMISFAQQRMWFLDQLHSGDAAYNVAVAWRLRGEPDADALERSLGEIVRRHEVLRTSFPIADGQPVPRVGPVPSSVLARVALEGVPASEREDQARERVRAEMARPFDLEHGPVFRAQLVRLSPHDHVLVLTMHHIVSDGWSLGVLCRELGALYEAFVAGRSSPLAELPIQYADFAVWQREWMQGEVLGKQLAYWTRQLEGVAELDLPTDRPRSPRTSHRAAEHDWPLSRTLTDAIKRFSERHAVTPFMTLLAASLAVLHRYTGQEDVCVGTPIANRNRVEIEGLIGFFVNTLALRTDLSGDPTFAELVARVRETTMAAYAHQDLPFERLVKELQLDRDPVRNPLFDVVFSVQNAPYQPFALTGLVVEPYRVTSGHVRFDVEVHLFEDDERFHGLLLYRADLFDRVIMEHLAGHFDTLLAAAIADPDRRVSALPLLTEPEVKQLSAGPAERSAGERCLHRGFEAQVARTPERVAVVCEGQALTYRELNRRANGVARRLRALGVGPEVLVGLCVERSLEMVVGILAILKAGGAYVPLDPTYPPGRLAFMLEDAAVPVLLTQERLVAELPPHRAAVVALDAAGLADSGDGADGDDLPGGASPDNLAYVIYTSGSTGQPKGTLITHRNVARLMEATERWYGFGPDDVWTLFHSYAFDFSVWELWGALWYGGRLVVVPYWVSRSPESFLDLLEREQVTVLNQTPSAFRQLAHVILEAGGARALALRYVIFGGEALELQGLRPWFARYGDRHPQLVNMYGITETTVHVTYRPITMADVEAETGSVIGVPIPDLAVYLLDRYGKLVPVGVPGELYVGGGGVGRGYLNRPELTAARFVPDPFTGTPGARLYRSGDLARRLPDGDLEYLGRLDHQVKIRGFRIELGEIEAVLGKHEEVREVAVVAREDVAGRRELVAYIVPRRPPGPPVGELRHFLEDRLPDYMIPAAMVTLDVLPLTANGKVDRRALPAPEAAHRAAANECALPETPLEVAMARIWGEVLGVEQVGIHDSFFGLGGDSILILQVIARARLAGLRITAADMFRNPTIAGLIPFVASEVVPPAEQGMLTGPVGLTPIQQWFFELDPVEPDHWNQAFRLAVVHELEPRLLEQALLELVRHHDALRLRYEQTPEGWQQSYRDLPPSVQLKVVDVASLPDAEQDAATDALGAEVGASLSLSDGRLVAAAYVRRGRLRGDRVLLAIHHLAVDGVSWRILLEDLERAYAQLRAGQPVTLPPKTASFKHWAERLAAHAQSETVRAEMEHWASVGSAEGLPVDIEPPGPNTVESARTVSVAFDREETLALVQKVPAAYHTQLNEVLLTALVQATTEWTGRPTLVLDLEGHGREPLGEETVDVSRTVGWFTTIFPVRLEVRADVGPGEALKAVKEQLRQIPNRGLGYGLLGYMTRDAAIARQARACGPADLVFNYLGQFDPSDRVGAAVRLTDEPCGPLYSGQSTRHHLVEVNSGIVGGRLRVAWTYSASAYRGASIERVAARFAEALRALLAHCLSPEAGGYTPSDFPDADLTQEELDAALETLDEDDGAEPRVPAANRGVGEPVSDWRGPR